MNPTAQQALSGGLFRVSVELTGVADTFLKRPEKIRGCKERNLEVH